MKYLQTYELFLESRQVAKAELYFSIQFVEILKKISNNSDSIVAKYLVRISRENSFEHTATYVDITNKNDTISFLPAAKIKTPSNFDSSNYLVAGRTEIKIGRFIRTLTSLKLFDLNINDKEIETFVNLYKAEIDSRNEKHKLFEVVSGDQILHFYQSDNYARESNGSIGGTLGGSCMNNSSSYVKFYAENTESVRMLILKNESNKDLIDGRALIWNLTYPENKTFLDRIYTRKDSDVNMFIEYAKQNDWLFKSSQTYGNQISDADHVEAMVKKGDYSFYPYLDTLKYYDPLTGKLSSIVYPKTMRYYDLSSAGGGYTLHKAVEMGWDSYNNREEEKDNLVWCPLNNGFCSSDDAIYLEYKEISSYPSDDIVYSTINYRHYFKDDCYFSKSKDTYIYKELAALVIMDDEGNTDYMSKRDKDDNWFEYKGKNYSTKLGVYDGRDYKWILKSDAILVHKRTDYMNAYLTKDDAEKYSIKIDTRIDDYLSKSRYDYQKFIGITDRLDSEDQKLYDSLKDDIDNDDNEDSPYYIDRLVKRFKNINPDDLPLEEIRYQILSDVLKDNPRAYEDKFIQMCSDMLKHHRNYPNDSYTQIRRYLIELGMDEDYVYSNFARAISTLSNFDDIYVQSNQDFNDLMNYCRIRNYKYNREF